MGIKTKQQMIMSEGGRLKSFIVDPIEAFFFFNEDIKRQGTKITNLTIFYIPYNPVWPTGLQ
jgi:hypothetical protein